MLKVFANKGETGAIPLNAENLNYNFNEVLNLIYPIGAIIIKDTDTDYSNYLGFSWQKVFAGKTLVGLDTSDSDFNSIGKTGGEKSHTLTLNEIPSHGHSQWVLNKNDNGYRKPSNVSNSSDIGTNGYAISLTNDFHSDDTKGWSHGTLSALKGGDQAHNNLQPYTVVAFWKRIE